MTTFSIASREVLLTPLQKYSFLVFAQWIRSPAVKAANSLSPEYGGSLSSKICWNMLQNKIPINWIKRPATKKLNDLSIEIKLTFLVDKASRADV